MALQLQGESLLVGMTVLLLFLYSSASLPIHAEPSQSGRSSDCKRQCGNVSIPYPFGFGDEICHASVYNGFKIICNDTGFHPPKPFFGGFEIMEVLLNEGQLRVRSMVASDCYDQAGRNTWQRFGSWSTRFTFSHTRNNFVALGCDTQALFTGMIRDNNFTVGCITYCGEEIVKDSANNCSGVGCCMTAVPRGLGMFNVSIRSYNNHSHSLTFNNCSYAFLVEEGQYAFNVSHLKYYNTSYKPPVVLDWFIGNQTCNDELMNSKDYACISEDSECFNSSSAMGYNCKCKKGYKGNPYIQGQGSCQDIDECLEAPPDCDGRCVNTKGSYKCIKSTWRWHLGISIGALLLVLLIVTCVRTEFQRRKLVEQKIKNEQMRQRIFEQNGGRILEQEIYSRPGNAFKLFTEEELATATDNFHMGNLIGRGGHGVVFRGTLENRTTQVAIKKSKVVDERQSKEFAREMVILSQISHMNVVKLLGCCLEVEIPMLVYEFVPGGTLHDFIHNPSSRIRSKNGCQSTIPMATRLRIAKEVAEALDYLHSHASEHPIIHRDVKASNILLDERCRVKVSDFGASILVSADGKELDTCVQGTWGYLDPEYVLGHELTEKSDVYSFGVLLAELLTGKMPMDKDGGLANKFVSSVKENRLLEIVDARIETKEERKLLMEVAEMATRCLSANGKDRPTMKNVATTLYMLGSSKEHPWAIDPYATPEEAESLLGSNGAGSGPSTMTSISKNGGGGNVSTSTSVSISIGMNHALRQIEAGR